MRTRSLTPIGAALLVACMLPAYAQRPAPARSSAPPCTPTPGRSAERVEGEVAKGQLFSKTTYGGWVFKLVPMQEGWSLQITMKGRETEDLSSLTPPWHVAPNPRHIDGWHFRNADNTSPNDGSVNAPQELREFIFSPQVGREIQGPLATSSPSGEEVERVRAFGRGWLHLDEFQLTPPRRGERASFERLTFSACLTWPAR
jgi:hypothetical protein